jgi:hypothetical protein
MFLHGVSYTCVMYHGHSLATFIFYIEGENVDNHLTFGYLNLCYTWPLGLALETLNYASEIDLSRKNEPQTHNRWF